MPSTESYSTEKGSGNKEKLRLSVAERKKLKKQGMTASDIGILVQRRQDTDSFLSTFTDDKTSRNLKAGSDFRDAKFYMAYGTEDEQLNFSESSMQPNAGLRTAEAQSAYLLNEAILDVAPDDAIELNKKRRVVRWDAKKRKFVKQSIEEIANLKGPKSKLSRLENGQVVKSAPAGEMYNKWKKRTKREITAPGFGDVDDRPFPNAKVNRGVKEEIKGADELRKMHREKDNNKNKNMRKDKRTKLEGQARKKKAALQAAALKKGTKAGNRKQIAILRY